MRVKLAALCGALACCAVAPSGWVWAAAIDPARLSGDWLAPAEDADDVDALITVSFQDGVWHGHIKAIKQTRADQKLLDGTPCTKCAGPQHGQALKGLEVIWGMHEQDGVLQSGHILDPGDGAIYDCEMQLSADGRTLKVVAYKGLKLLGHSMTWIRP